MRRIVNASLFGFLFQDQSVIRVTALDQDKGINDAMVYTIEGEPHQLGSTGCFHLVSK